jgi:hypothetical protein
MEVAAVLAYENRDKSRQSECPSAKIVLEKSSPMNP